MPNLSQLSMEYGLHILVKPVPDQVLGQIRTLRMSCINTLVDSNNNSMKRLFTIFPQLKHLHVHSTYSTDEIMIFLHGFKHLLSASFSSMRDPSHLGEERCPSDIEFRLDQMRSVEGLNLSYRATSSRIYIWF